MPQPISRSENAESTNDLLAPIPNHNVTVFQSKGSFAICVLLVWVGYLLTGAFTQDKAIRWTITNTAHNLITYVIFHQIMGVPFDQDQGKYNRMTYWEQLDYERQWTASRKFYTFVPIILLMFANHYCHGHLWWFNVVQSSIILIAKTPIMHGIRIFGIGKY
eukprot:CFRG3679T1